MGLGRLAGEGAGDKAGDRAGMGLAKWGARYTVGDGVGVGAKDGM